jgi:hypothetical protein
MYLVNNYSNRRIIMFKWLAKIFTPSVKVAQDEAKVIEKTITKNGVGYAPKNPKSKKSSSY